jgi:hypothetical protein
MPRPKPFPIPILLLLLLSFTALRAQYSHHLEGETLVIGKMFDHEKSLLSHLADKKYNTLIFEDWYKDFPVVPHPETVHTIMLGSAFSLDLWLGIEQLPDLYPAADTLVLGWYGGSTSRLSLNGPVIDKRSIQRISERHPEVVFRIGGEAYLYTGEESMTEDAWLTLKYPGFKPAYYEKFLNPESVFLLTCLPQGKWPLPTPPEIIERNFDFCPDSLSSPVFRFGWECSGLYKKEKIKNARALVLCNASSYLHDIPFEWFEAVDSIWFLGDDSDYVFDLPPRFFEMHEPKVIMFGIAADSEDWWVYGMPYVSISVSRQVLDKIRKRWPECSITIGKNASVGTKAPRLVKVPMEGR